MERDRVLAALDADFAALHVVELSPEVVTRARALLVGHPLRAADAIQLASALLLRHELGRDVSFAVHDGRLKAAAKDEGLTVVP